MYIGFLAKYPLFLSDFIETLISFDKVSKNNQISNIMKNLSSGIRVVPCGLADGQRTDMTKLVFTSRNFAKAPKKKGDLYFTMTVA